MFEKNDISDLLLQAVFFGQAPWEAFLRALEKKCTVIPPEVRGLGRGGVIALIRPSLSQPALNMMLSRAYKKVVDQGISCTHPNECENMVWDGGEREIAKYIEQDGMRGVRIQWEKPYGMRILTKENRNQSKTLWVSKVICYRNLRQLCLYWSTRLQSPPPPHIMQKMTPTSSNCKLKYKLTTALNMTL